MQKKTDSNQRRPTMTSFLVFLAVIFGLSLWMTLPYIVPLVMGGLLALLTMPIFKSLRARKVPPKTASTLVTLCTVLLVILPLGFFTSLAVKQGITIAKNISNKQTLSLQEVVTRMSHWKVVEMLELSPEDLSARVHDWIASGSEMGTAFLLGAVGNLPSLALQLALAIISCYFLLLDGGRFFVWVKGRLFLDEDVQRRAAQSFKETAVASVWAMLATGSGQSLVILLGFVALSVPGAFLAAGATFILALIPMVGCGPVWVIGSIYLYTQGETGKVVAMVVIGLFASVIDNIIRPLILKGRSDMHPLVSLVAIFGGIGLFGIVGVLLGPIIVAVLISLLQIWPAVADRFAVIKNSNPVDPEKSS